MTLLTSVCSPRRIAGVATDTIVESTRIMKKPMTIAQRAGHGSWPAGTPPRGGADVGRAALPRPACSVTPVVRSSPAMVLPSRCLAQHPRLSTRAPTAVTGLSGTRARDRSGVRPARREPQRVVAGERDHPPRQVGVRAAQARLDAVAVRRLDGDDLGAEGVVVDPAAAGDDRQRRSPGDHLALAPHTPADAYAQPLAAPVEPEHVLRPVPGHRYRGVVGREVRGVRAGELGV